MPARRHNKSEKIEGRHDRQTLAFFQISDVKTGSGLFTIKIMKDMKRCETRAYRDSQDAGRRVQVLNGIVAVR